MAKSRFQSPLHPLLSAAALLLAAVVPASARAASQQASPAAVTIADAGADEGDAIAFTVTLDTAVRGGFKVTPAFTDGTATQGTDYTAYAGSLEFVGTAGESVSFTVPTTEDADAEADETFTVALAVSGASGSVTATDTATGTIRNDDADPYVGLDSPSVTEGDAGTTTLTFTARLSDENGRAKTGSRTITASYRVSSEDGDAATAGTDYTATSGTLTFAPGETVKTVDVTVLGDTEDEDDETVTLRWTDWAHVILVQYAATGTIVDDDEPPPAAVSIADAGADEGDAIAFTVTLDRAVPGGLTVTPSYTDGTATAGTDYTANAGALAFAGTAGESVGFTVSTTEDADAEADETFTVGLTVSGTPETVTATSTATGTIRNDDHRAAPSVTLSVNPSSVTEGDEATSVTVTATASSAVAANTPVTVTVGGGTATSGTDYEAVSDLALEIPAGGTTGAGAFMLTPVEDTDIEGKETIQVTGSASGLSVTGATLTLDGQGGGHRRVVVRRQALRRAGLGLGGRRQPEGDGDGGGVGVGHLERVPSATR